MDSAFDRLLARVAATDPAPTFVRVPATAGRYQVGRRLGRGGLGVVHAGWDPELAREVALKFVRPDRIVGESGATLFERLRREARTLAQLDHPGVVRVFDIGETEGQMYIAMELLEGSTLRAWARKQSSWRVVANACIEAARGIAAAHACGVIHRDIKPDNVVVVDRTERVVVVDFGLADPQAAIGPTGNDSADSDERLTRDGAIMGTHGYLAPELVHDGIASAASDQYAWCVSCHELLTATGGEIPTKLRRVLERGRADDPAGRHASMDALIHAVERARGKPRTWISVLLLSTAIVPAFALGTRELVEYRRAVACEAEGAVIESAWNDDTREAVRTSLLTIEAGYASDMVNRILPRIEARANAWRASQTEACLDGSVRGASVPEQHDRAMWCLEEHRIDLEAIVARLMHADRSVLQNAIALEARLPSVQRCRDAGLLATLPPPPDPAQRSELLAVRADLATALLHDDADAALTTAEASVVRTVALGWPPLEAAARLRLGRAWMEVGDRELAIAELENAYFVADRVGAWGLAADAARLLCLCHRGALEQAERWSKAAEIALGQLPEGERMVEIDRLVALSVAYKTAGDFDRAAPLLRQSVERCEEVYGEDHPKTAILTRMVGALLFESGDLVNARALLQRSLTLIERSLGSEHPEMATALDNLGLTFAEAGDYARARPLIERALAVRQRSLDADDLHIVASLNNLAAIHSGLGEHARAVELMQRAIPMQERLFGPEHSDVAGMIYNLGNYYLRLQDYENAVATHERAFILLEQSLGPNRLETIQSLESLGDAHARSGNLDEAERRYGEAIAALERMHGPDDPRISRPLQGLAKLEVDRDRAAIGLPLARRALDLARRGEPDPARVAEVEFVLARAMWGTGEDRGRAREHVEHAREVLAEATDIWQPLRADIDTWLAEHSR
jgi:tetratricopeptide (TPR) repeat protein/predicted Ser/Thr protein kinase